MGCHKNVIDGIVEITWSQLSSLGMETLELMCNAPMLAYPKIFYSHLSEAQTIRTKFTILY